MKQRPKKLLLIPISILILSSCQNDQIVPSWSDDQYLLLEHIDYHYNEVIEGEYHGGHVEWDGFNGYQYDPNDGSFWCTIFVGDDPKSSKNTEMTKNTKMVIARTSSESGDAVGGYGGMIYEVHDFPRTAGNITVTGLNENGTVYFNFRDSSFVLAPNEEWSRTSINKLDTSYLPRIVEDTIWINEYEYADIIYSEEPDTCIIQYTNYDHIINQGLFEKSKFTVNSYY